MKKKVLVVSALYRLLAVDQYRWVRFASECLVLTPPVHAFSSAVFSEWQIAALFFFSADPAVTSYLRRRRKVKSLIR